MRAQWDARGRAQWDARGRAAGVRGKRLLESDVFGQAAGKLISCPYPVNLLELEKLEVSYEFEYNLVYEDSR